MQALISAILLSEVAPQIVAAVPCRIKTVSDATFFYLFQLCFPIPLSESHNMLCFRDQPRNTASASIAAMRMSILVELSVFLLSAL